MKIALTTYLTIYRVKLRGTVRTRVFKYLMVVICGDIVKACRKQIEKWKK